MKKIRRTLYSTFTICMLLLGCYGIFGFITAPGKAKKAMDEIQQMLEQQQAAAEEKKKQIQEEQDRLVQENIASLGERPKTLASYKDAGEMNVTVIGDSVTLSALDALYETFPHGYMDAVFGRTIYEGQIALDELAESNSLGQVVVFSLGTNCETFPEDYEYLIEHSQGRPVFLVSTYGVNNDSNEIMKKIVRTTPNVYYIDWETPALAHQGEWILADGLHPNYDGSLVYADLIRQAINTYVLAPYIEMRNQLVP